MEQEKNLSLNFPEQKEIVAEQLDLDENPYRHQDNMNRDHSQDKEEVDPVSMTIPDQSLSINQIMERFAKGLPLGGRDVSFELDDDEEDYEGMPDLSGMDLAEIQQLKSETDARVKELEMELKDIADKQNDKKAKEALADAAYKKLKESRKGQMLLARAEAELDKNDELNPDKEDGLE